MRSVIRPIAIVLLLAACGNEAPRQVIPWAWERREDLRFVRGEVAYLAQTITLRSSDVDVHPRMQPLFIDKSTRVTPVVRIETHRAALDDAQRGAVVAAIDRLHSDHVQIDFDATASERAFYRALITDLHRTIPHITITALASWCSDDRWLAGLPIEDAIPMLFQMGADDRVVRARLARGEDFREPLCRMSAGITIDEKPPRLPERRRVTRAIVLGRAEIAESLVPEMHRNFDDEIKQPLNEFAAAPPSRRRIEALNLLIHAPGLSPYITSFEGRINQRTPITDDVHTSEHENYWCAGGVRHYEVVYPNQLSRRVTLRVPKFAEALKDEVAKEKADLRISGSSFMLRGVVVWANEYPNDPRLPEALARAIGGAQYACPDANTRKYAAAAFKVLHEKYGDTEWAKRTKYWYDGRD